MTQREEKILATIKEFANKLPKFPDGRIDYSNSNIAPVVIIFLRHKDKILLLKRSDKVLAYQGKWSVVAGFFDEVKPIQEKILEEVKEETGINKDDILSIHIGKPYEFLDAEIERTWIRHPVLVELKKEPSLKLDWEHEEYKWVSREQLKEFDTIPNTVKTLEYAFK